MPNSSRNLINTFWNMADTVIYPVTFLAFTPFFLRHLGEKMFGIYMLCISVLVTFQILNLGLGVATLRNVARYHHLGDSKRLSETININLSFSLFLFFMCLLIGGLIALLVCYAGLFNIEASLKQYVAVCIFLVSCISGLKFCEQILQYSFKGFERFDIAAGFNLCIRLGTLLLNVLTVLSGYSVRGMLLVSISVTLTFIILQLGGVRRVFKNYTFLIYYNKEHLFEELRFGIWIWLQSLVVIITYQTDRFVVTYIGLETLSYYALTATIFNHIQMMIGSLAPWLFPRIAGMKERNEDVIPFYRSMQAAVVSFGLAALCIFTFVKQPLLSLWVGPAKFYKLDEFIPLFSGFVMFSVLTYVPLAFLNAAGFEKLSFRVHFLLGALTIGSIFTMYFLAHTAQGVIIGLIIGTAIFVPCLNYLLYRIAGSKNLIMEVFLSSIPPALALMVALSAAWWQKGIYFLLMLAALKTIYFTKENFDIKWLKA